jgi:hypothetical protein
VATYREFLAATLAGELPVNCRCSALDGCRAAVRSWPGLPVRCVFPLTLVMLLCGGVGMSAGRCSVEEFGEGRR